ncbi:MAG TPA: two-component regulator propeller domain-containing protein, partial [Bryobacteraceae bacterium]|nr:two-component regulator propeller domain-containing protein [Bryobacteraceae bacterium]
MRALHTAGILLLFWATCIESKMVAANSSARLPIQEGTNLLFVPLAFRPGSVRSAHSHVAQIVEDSIGFIWFGTADGLRRYDGYRFRDFRPDSTNPASIRGVSINALFRDRSGSLWVAADEHLDKYNPETESFSHFKETPGLFEGPVNDIYQDHAGVMWLATNRGLTRYDPANGKLIRYLSNPVDSSTFSSNSIRSTYETTAGAFWVANAGSIELFDRGTGKVLRRIPLGNPLRRHMTASVNPEVRFLEDHNGVLWIASARDGLAMLDRAGRQLTFFAVDPGAVQPGAWSLLEDRVGALWVGTNGGGLIRIDPGRTAMVRYRNDPANPDSLSANIVLTLFQDHEEGVWAGVAGGVIVRIPGRRLPFIRITQREGSHGGLLTDDAQVAFEDSDGIVWAGSTGVVTRIDRSGRKSARHALGFGVADVDVISIAEDARGFLWFGTKGGGLIRFDRRTQASTIYRHDPDDPKSLSHDAVHGLFVDRAGVLWAATDDGLDRFDAASSGFQTFRPPGGAVERLRAIAQDRAGALWLASWYSGVQRFDPGSGQFRTYRSSDHSRLSSDTVAAVLVDRNDEVWAGTENGLDHLDRRTDTFHFYSDRDGLPNSNINGIAEDAKGTLWITTHNGISHFDPRAKTFDNYYRSDGIFGGLNGVWKSRDGELFFPADTGLTTLRPDHVEDQRFHPRIVLTAFEIAGKTVAIGDGSPLRESISLTNAITLDPRQNSFSIEFTALSYLNPERTRYRYRLTGVESAWNEVDNSQRLARYTTLAPGHHRFLIESRTSHSGWGGDDAGLEIVLLPPWWQTWPFRIAFITALIMALYAAYHFRLRQVSRQLNLRFEERLGERTRIARELHDTLLQGFLSAAMQLDVATDSLPNESPLRARLGAVLEMMRSVTAEGRNAIRGMRHSRSDTRNLAEALLAMRHEFSSSPDAAAPATLRVAIDGEVRDLHPIFRDEAYRIGREAITNAFRHSGASRIDVQIAYGVRRFYL